MEENQDDDKDQEERGEPAVEALTANGNLVHELGTWLDNANDADTLQRLTGVFNHLSRSNAVSPRYHSQGN